MKNYFQATYTQMVKNDPDLIIRTAGEKRLSNFLLWQSAYSELYFVKKTWPDFTRRDLLDALKYFKTKKRTFGSIQLNEKSLAIR